MDDTAELNVIPFEEGGIQLSKTTGPIASAHTVINSARRRASLSGTA